ncbi:MAG: tetratricopeptide repeat protein, partial [Gemmataceae bacterium]
MSTSATRLLPLLALTAVLAVPAARAQMSADEQAALLLNSAKRAYNEKNYPFAADRFREFLSRFGGHRDASQARYGLALCLSEGPERKYDQALEQLNHLAGNRGFTDYPFVLYYTGLARRGLGVKALDLAAERPNEAASHKAVARQRFEEAARAFAEAHTAFAARMPKEQADGKAPSVEQEWAIRARCDQAEMLLHGGKPKEAREAVAPVLTDKTWGQSRYLALGLYYHGFASFQLDDPFAAGKALSRKNVLADEVFGTHAHYLLARIHHLNTKQNEREDARQHYQAVLTDHEAAKKAGQERLRQPEQLKNDPETRVRLERLLKGPPPDHVARATFFLAALQYEDGRFAEALEHFKTFATQYPNAPLAPEARLRIGFCQAQMKQNDDAIRTLQPLVDKEPALADQALYWIARAELNKADPAKPETYRPGIDTLRKAADRANQRVHANPPDPRARGRRGDALLDLAEAQQLSKQFREAAGTYQQIAQEKLLPDRDDEVQLNLATALQLAGDFPASDRTCAAFVDKHAKSTLLPAVLFRHAENSALQALAAEKLPDPASRARETKKHNDEAIKRYAVVVEKYPEYAHVQLARQGLGMAHYRKGDLESAQKALEAIPSADRAGELAVVNYNLADVLLRGLPARADDAVAAGRLEERLKAAGDLLEAYLGAGDTPHTPDALLKLGYCQGRMAKLLAQPPEQQK